MMFARPDGRLTQRRGGKFSTLSSQYRQTLQRAGFNLDPQAIAIGVSADWQELARDRNAWRDGNKAYRTEGSWQARRKRTQEQGVISDENTDEVARPGESYTSTGPNNTWREGRLRVATQPTDALARMPGQGQASGTPIQKTPQSSIYNCHQCGKSCRDIDELIRHWRTMKDGAHSTANFPYSEHRGIRLVGCVLCGKGPYRSLERHAPFCPAAKHAK